MRYLGYLLLLIGRVILFPIYFLSGLVPRRPDLWVFGSWGGFRFADNSAAFFLYCQEVVSEHVELVWISRDREIVKQLRDHGYQAYWIWSLPGIIKALRAKFHIFDCFSKDTNYWLSRGSVGVNLWGGVPLKVFERDIDNPASRYYQLFNGNLILRGILGMMMPWHLKRPDVVIATSPETAHITGRSFGVSEANVCITGFPRNDALLDSSMNLVLDDENITQAFHEAVLGDQTVFLYLPTFRDNGANFIDFAWPELNKFLKEIDARLFFKTHPDDQHSYKVHLSNVMQLPSATEVNNLMLGADALISDYSSVIFDFMILDRPIIYYVPDLADFESGCRSFNFHPHEVAVGPVCESFAELKDALQQVAAATTNIASSNRAEVISRLHQYCDSRSNERVLAMLNERFHDGRLRYNSNFDAGPLCQTNSLATSGVSVTTSSLGANRGRRR
jgi:CDP-glycerol glycerophosphotransferase (TagB/SpsB family)